MIASPMPPHPADRLDAATLEVARRLERHARLDTATPFAMPADAVAGFFGPHRFLSNFWHCRVVFEGCEFPTTEHAYQAAKTLDLPQRRRIALAGSAAAAKALGRRIAIRRDWDQVKLAVMLLLNRQKFADPRLAELLLRTGTRPLFEVTTRWNDPVWGVVECRDARFRGANRLGAVLMLVRAELAGLDNG